MLSLYMRKQTPKNSSATKINKQAAPGYLLFTHCLFDATKNKHHHQRKGLHEKYFQKPKKACKKNNQLSKKKKRKEMIPLTNKEKKSYCKQKVCDICKKEFSQIMNVKNTRTLQITVRKLEIS